MEVKSSCRTSNRTYILSYWVWVNRCEKVKKIEKNGGIVHLDVLPVEGLNAVKYLVLEGKLVGQYHGMIERMEIRTSNSSWM